MEKIKNALFVFVFAVICISIGYGIRHMTFPKCPPEGQVLVSQNWIDSLQVVASSKPEIIEIVKDSIIHVPGPVEYVEIPAPVEIDEETNYYQDTLQTPHFDLFLFDTLRQNKIISRGFTYDLFVPETITKTITLLQKVPFPYEVDMRGRLYGAVNAGTIISADLSYRMKDSDNMIGIGMGYVNGKKFVYGRYQFKIF